MANILVVDDHAPSRAFLVNLLTYKGHHLLEAADGAEALARVRVERPDLVISDILMPTMDGYEFVRQLRAEPELSLTNVVFWTATYHVREARALAQRWMDLKRRRGYAKKRKSVALICQSSWR